MNAEFTAKLMAQNVDLEALVKIQADRIAELEKEVSHLKHINKNWSISEGWALQRIAELEKQSEPVAWIRSGDDQLSLVKEKDDGYMVWKPLYLAPQTKPLSDEEILEIADNLQESSQPYNINFARAIEDKHGIR